MKCIRCGKDIADTSRFCGFCGAEQISETKTVRPGNSEITRGRVVFGQGFENVNNVEGLDTVVDGCTDGSMITRTVIDPEKERATFMKLTIGSVIGAVLGFFMCFWFFSMSENVYDDTMEMIVVMFAIFMGIMGFILVVCAILLPILSATQIGKIYLEVYPDHIEGRAGRVVGNFRKNQEIYLKYTDITNVRCKAMTTSSTAVEIQLPDGSVILCNAENANEVASEIRKRLKLII